jgi:hypothetical protein
MIPAGYMLKRVERKPDWLATSSVLDIYSVGHCISKDFADYVPFWKHNGYWLFDSPDVIHELVQAQQIDIAGHHFFYYEVYEYEFFQDDHTWHEFQPEALATHVHTPITRVLEGYDVVTFERGTTPECSPLSCNSLATRPGVAVNRHCLLASLEVATHLLESGLFADSEPGPYRIFAVYSLPDVSM